MNAGTYWKVGFERDGTSSARREPDPPGIAWRAVEDVSELEHVVAEVLSDSPDASDSAAVQALGAASAATNVLTPTEGYRNRPTWWQVLLYEDSPAGFVLPVIFEGCDRDGLDEGTIFHMGVVPAFRVVVLRAYSSRKPPRPCSATVCGESSAKPPPRTRP